MLNKKWPLTQRSEGLDFYIGLYIMEIYRRRWVAGENSINPAEVNMSF